MTIYLDPDETSKGRKTIKYLNSNDYVIIPNLEARTGADVMVSPDNLPLPVPDRILSFHINEMGAKLIQVKWGHDLTGSISGRLNESLDRMLKIGAMPWQSLLLFIGVLFEDEQTGNTTINNQMTYGHAIKWKNLDSALMFWTERGGCIDFPLMSGKHLLPRLEGHENHLNRFRNGEDTKTVWPTKPVLYEETVKSNISNPLLEREWKVAQKLKVRDDIAVLWSFLPGIGSGKAADIYNWMGHHNVRQDWNGFMDILRDRRILQIKGVGKRTIEKIEWYLFRTKEERC